MMIRGSDDLGVGGVLILRNENKSHFQIHMKTYWDKEY